MAKVVEAKVFLTVEEAKVFAKTSRKPHVEGRAVRVLKKNAHGLGAVVPFFMVVVLEKEAEAPAEG